MKISDTLMGIGFYIVVGTCAILAALHTCQSVHTLPKVDTIQREITRLELRNAELEHEYRNLLNKRSEPIKEATRLQVVTNYIRVHDTLRLRYTDSVYCHAMEAQADSLWQVVRWDSAIFVTHQERAAIDSQIIAQYETGYNRCTGERDRLRVDVDRMKHRRNNWRVAGIVGVIVGIFAGLM